MRHQERPRAGLKERPRRARQRFGAGLGSGDGVAGGQHHPVGVELQLRDFACREQPIVEFGRLSRNGPATVRQGPSHRRRRARGWQNKRYGNRRAGRTSPWSRSHPCRDECRKRQRRGPLRPRSIRPRYRATLAAPTRARHDRRRRPARIECGVGEAGHAAEGRLDGDPLSAPLSCAGSNRGSPKPVIGLTACSRRAKPRSAFRLATEGNTDTA
jgi:hypothetical protein